MTDVRTLQAPGDPGDAGLFVALAIVLVVGLVLAHLRVLRAVARANRPVPAPHPSAEGSSTEAADRTSA